MKIVLVNLDTSYLRNDKHMPLNIGYLSSYAKKYGGFEDITIIEKMDTPSMIEEIDKLQPDIVGVSSASATFPDALMIASRGKKGARHSKTKWIIGGVHITSLPEDFNNSSFDVAVIAEGEQTFLELLKLYDKTGKLEPKQLKKIKGIIYRKDLKTVKKTSPRPFIKDLDTIPFPDRDIFDLDYYLQPRREALSNEIGIYVPIITARGCPYRCTFCPAWALWGSTRFHSAEYVLREIEHVIEKYDPDGIRIWDDTFTVNKPRLKKIIELIEEKGINKRIEFYVYGRSNLIDEEMCKLLKKMNVRHISFGLESGSDKILKYVKKRATVKDNYRAVRLCKKYGIEVMGFLMVGFPPETAEDMRKTEKLLDEVDYSMVCQLTIYPASDMYYEFLQRGLIDKNIDFTRPEIFNEDLIWSGMPREEFIKWYTKLDKKAKAKMFDKRIKFKWRYLKYLRSKRFIVATLKRWKQVLKYLR